MAYKLPNPERERTERNRELRRLRERTEAGQERAERAATLAVVFHDERDINHVMELAQIVIDDAEDGIATLIEAYLHGVDGAEDRMERLAMLCNVARWTDQGPLGTAARDMGMAAATTWVSGVQDEVEQADRLSLIERRFDADLRRAVQDRIG
jgi:hypothetical protein